MGLTIEKHRLSYAPSEGHNLEAGFHSCCDSGETDKDENICLSSQVCSEATSDTS